MKIYGRQNKRHINALLCMVFFCCAACSEKEHTAIMWTDRSDTVVYAQAYNASQDKYKINVVFVKNLAEKLLDKKSAPPDMVFGSGVSSAAVMSKFKKLNYLFSHSLKKENFYEALLKTGAVKKTQYALPVSFNLPAIKLKKNSTRIEKHLTIDVEELKNRGAEFNKKQGENFVNKGFSPLWDKNHNFLTVHSRLSGADFHESNNKKNKIPEWDTEAFNSSLEELKEWVNKINGGAENEKDFIYKYFFNPDSKLLLEGRILFAYAESKNCFFEEENNSEIDFRYLVKDGMLPVLDGFVSFAIHKKSHLPEAGEDFAYYFFNAENQDAFLKTSKQYHINDTVFGIADGFSALQNVTEFVFPKYYEALLAHIPPASYLAPPPVRAVDWNEIKDAVIIPYILDEISLKAPPYTLREKLSEWYFSKGGVF